MVVAYWVPSRLHPRPPIHSSPRPLSAQQWVCAVCVRCWCVSPPTPTPGRLFTFHKKYGASAEEMAWWFRALGALPDDLGLILSAYMVPHNRL